MFVVGKEFAGALRAALLFASQDETRPWLNCIQIESVGSAIRVVSTDGHTLWCSDVPARDSTNDPPPVHQTPWIMSLEDADELVRLLKTAPEVEVLIHKRMFAGKEYAPRADKGAPYRHVIPALGSMMQGKVLPEFATTYVARACEAIIAYGKGFAPEVPKKGTKDDKDAIRVARDGYLDPPLAWRVAGDFDPAVFFSPKFPAAFAIVMPRKADGKCSIEQYFARVKSASAEVAA